MTTDPNSAPAEPTPDALAEVGVYTSATEGFEHGLVVLATGRPYWLVSDDRGHRLLVEPSEEREVRRQLACYDRESIGWPPKPVEDVPALRHLHLVSPLVWALLAIAAFWGEINHPDWITRGALDSDAIFHHGEWWRPVTALFLHADGSHLIANGLNGILVFSAVISTFGRWRGWALLIASSVLGNVASAAVNFDDPYRSIGASTAVFAAVGLLTGRAIRLAATAPRLQRPRAMFVPLAAGATVLALYGAGGVHIDVIAHLTGFGVGTVAALLVPSIRSPRVEE